MSVIRLATFACLLVILQISHSDARIDPNNVTIDKPTGRLRLNINRTALSDDEIEQVRAITVYNGEDSQKYCKFAEIGPESSFLAIFGSTFIKNPNTTFLVTSQPGYWCFDDRDNVSNICCDSEGECFCPEKNRYNCYCSGPEKNN